MLEEDGEGMTTDLQFYRRTCGTKRSLRSANADRKHGRVWHISCIKIKYYENCPLLDCFRLPCQGSCEFVVTNWCTVFKDMSDISAVDGYLGMQWGIPLV